jgi:TPP-dependent 2-oxoacid decarboxylase
MKAILAALAAAQGRAPPSLPPRRYAKLAAQTDPPLQRGINRTFQLLTRLTRESRRFEKPAIKRPSGFDTKVAAKDPISYQPLCGVLQAFLASSDILVSGCGNAWSMLPHMLLPEGVQYLGQYLWASIGWGTPARFGATVAAPDRQVIFVEGDGSHQLTATRRDAAVLSAARGPTISLRATALRRGATL